MQLKGKKVTHVTFGPGVVTNVEGSVVTVAFAQEEKKFLFPGAFSRFLVFEDGESRECVEQMLVKADREKERRQQAAHREHDRLKRLRQLKISPNSQAAFGFVANRREDVFSSWTVCSGRYVGGCSKGEPRVPVRLKANSACLLTECAPDAPETERRIIGAFMVREEFDGASCNDGIIHAHEKYRIALGKGETLPYWDYFEFEGKPPKWGNTELKYFSNRIMQRILYDLTTAVPDAEKRLDAAEFLRYFSAVNRLPDFTPEPAAVGS